MKRDYDLGLRILRIMESTDERLPHTVIVRELEGEYPMELVSHHCELLADEGLVKPVTTTKGEVLWYMPKRLTAAGHDFLAAAHDEGRWDRAKQRLADAGVGTTFTLLKETLEDFARKALGLPG